jgi:chemotaxis protein methyltransferase CheR
MLPTLPESLLQEFGRFVESRIGLHLPLGRLVDLERGLRAAAQETGWTDTEAFTRHLLDAPVTKDLQDLLAAHLTIGETYFYRDPRAFEVFEKEVLPPLIRSRVGKERKLRIWSAACCTGEEPYSIAMAVRRVLGDDHDWNVKILATDLNPRFLQRAAKGIYGPWSFRTLPEKMRERFFHRHSEDRWRIDDRIKQDVTFTGLNFLEDTFPSVANDTRALDVVFCRNVLMYFSRETASKVIAKLRKCLVEDGWLFTSATDAPRDLFKGFAVHQADGTIVYRRRDEAAVPQVAPFVIAPSQTEPPAVTLQIPSTRKPHSIRKATGASLTHRAEPVPATPLNVKGAKLQPSCDHRQEARRLADQGRFDEALLRIDLALESDKLDPLAHYLRGVILHEKNLDGEATVALNRALYLAPSFVLAHVTLGNLMRRSGKEKAARRCFENARDILRREHRDTVLPESGGMTAGRLLHMISTPQESAA